MTVRAERGMIVASQPLATRAGIEMLDAGGTAADAAVAAAAVLCVVDPRSTGIGGDLFALQWAPGDPAPVALAAAGVSPAGLTLDALAAAGFAGMPESGPWTVTVPGAVAGWERLLERHGRLGLERVLAPAIAVARDGFAVTPIVADEWRHAAPRLARDEAARKLFGRPPAAGDRWANPELADLMEAIARHGASVLYRGEIAERIAAAVEAAGGPLRASDLAAWQGPEWVHPLRRPYRGVEVLEPPPPGQGIVVLEALGIFEPLTAADRAEEEHLAIEALKLAFADAARWVADPAVEDVPVARLLSDEHLAERRAQIGATAAGAAPAALATDTVYLAAVDADGGACSLIQSLYEGFGSGIAVPGLGIVLQNRGANFVAEPDHPNRAAPRKRPYHTIVPAMLARDGRFAGCLGVVGGFMQPQGQMQILRHVLDHGMDLQAAVDAPRVRHLGGNRIAVEPACDPAIAAELARRGHAVGTLDRFSSGGAQAILLHDGVLHGASDPRKDGCALGR